MNQMTPIAWPVKSREMHNHHMDSTVWNNFKFRNDDVVVATWAKSGTTWTQQIVAQLIFNGAEGIDVSGPWPPDTMFTRIARTRYDAAICMYHDQALIPLKTLDMDHGVNVTLGLPIVRTSPDHGTAYDIAGKGIADPSSLIAALELAADLAVRRAAAARA